MFLSLWGCQLVYFLRTKLIYCQRGKKEKCLALCCLEGNLLGLRLGFRGPLFSLEMREPFDWSFE